jgi:hypothetical protein
MNKWFQELLITREIMLNIDVVRKIHCFFELHDALARMNDRGDATKRETSYTMLSEPAAERIMKRMQPNIPAATSTYSSGSSPSTQQAHDAQHKKVGGSPLFKNENGKL